PAIGATFLNLLSLPDALPICAGDEDGPSLPARSRDGRAALSRRGAPGPADGLRRGRVRLGDPALPDTTEAAASPHASAGGRLGPDRKSTRLNSSHVKISYAVL